MTHISKTLSVAAATLLAAVGLCASSLAGNCGPSPCPGYHGRSAGAYSTTLPAFHPHGVWVYRGGRAHTAPRTVHGVTVYAGGGGYASQMRFPEYTGGLEVVTLLNGATGSDLSIDAVCVASPRHEMPAARAMAGDRLPASAAGELFRCEDGFALRASANRPFGRTPGRQFHCVSGQSLWRATDGTLSCRAKAAMACYAHQRSCSEAAMRHTNGTGSIAIAARMQSDHSNVTVTRGMTLSGGVGYAPY
jgi:hypothetical protein